MSERTVAGSLDRCQGRKRQPLILLLGVAFPRFLQAFERNCPFTRSGQLENHVRTIARRRQLGSASAALCDDRFLKSLYETLQAWGIGTRASHLRPFSDFVRALQAKAANISELDDIALDQPDLNTDLIAEKLWWLISSLRIVTNNATLVPGSKALHHLLPDLVVPIDRAYTQTFFGWNNRKFQYSQSMCFYEAFSSFIVVARAVTPAQYVGPGWNTSLTKVIDNAIVGMFCEDRACANQPEHAAGPRALAR